MTYCIYLVWCVLNSHSTIYKKIGLGPTIYDLDSYRNKTGLFFNNREDYVFISLYCKQLDKKNVLCLKLFLWTIDAIYENKLLHIKLTKSLSLKCQMRPCLKINLIIFVFYLFSNSVWPFPVQRHHYILVPKTISK